ncbi:MAG: (d)CMP kinase [Desulfovibrio sp.]|nr:(d)CMP kinase [Desulfovibrio sp.]
MNTLSVITLDGPAGVGKTTLARACAAHLSLPYLDTGAMFRVLALKLGALDTVPEEQANALLADLGEAPFRLQGSGQSTTLLLHNTPIGEEIRTEAIAHLASRIAKLPCVRQKLAAFQRRMGEAQALVAEGRDMGTVVFPDAKVKFFLDASPKTRALRRMQDPKNRDTTKDLDALIAIISARDTQDRTRAIAPLRPADDAKIIDTSTLSIDEVLAIMLAHIRRLWSL